MMRRFRNSRKAERRQDKAAGQMPVRSVSTPRSDKRLGGAPAWAQGCTAKGVVEHELRARNRGAYSVHEVR